MVLPKMTPHTNKEETRSANQLIVSLLSRNASSWPLKR